MSIDNPAAQRRARGQVARRRGVVSGLLLLLLGAWGALIPFIGPYFHFAYTPDHAWRWTASRGWLEVLPGAVAALGGLLLLASSKRSVTVLGAWLAAAAGAWFVIGQSLVPILKTGDVGVPASRHTDVRVLESLAFFVGLGAVIIFIAAAAFGRLSIRSLGDIRGAQRTMEAEREEELAARREVSTDQPDTAPARVVEPVTPAAPDQSTPPPAATQNLVARDDPAGSSDAEATADEPTDDGHRHLFKHRTVNS